MVWPIGWVEGKGAAEGGEGEGGGQGRGGGIVPFEPTVLYALAGLLKLGWLDYAINAFVLLKQVFMDRTTTEDA